MTEKQKKAMEEMWRCYIASLECPDAENHFWDRLLNDAEAKAKAVGVSFRPGRGFNVKKF